MPLDQFEPLDVEIARLRDLDLHGLRARWRTATGRRIPAHIPKGLLVRMLAYRLQAEAYGDLDPGTIRFLDRVVSDRTLKAGKTLPQPDADLVRPGAVLTREWEGRQHRVMALADGFAWNGGAYRSLSEVARAITGTRWNGPRFFGLRDRGAQP
jgi:hypothetical protein